VVEEEIAKNIDGELSIGIVELSGMKDLMESLPPSGLQFLLNKVTAILRKELRGNDIIGRWNDISFSVMLPSTPGIAAKRTYDRISNALSQQVQLSSFDVKISLDPHIGGAIYNKPMSETDLFAHAETSLEQAYLSAQKSVILWELNSPSGVQKDFK
jgi:GGDEF domain-containing protein